MPRPAGLAAAHGAGPDPAHRGLAHPDRHRPRARRLSWTGPITPGQARDLAAAAAADPSCTWQLIITDDHGHAITTTTLRTRRPHGTGPPPGLISEVTITIQQSNAAGLGRDSRSRDQIAATLARTGSPADAADLAALTDLLASQRPELAGRGRAGKPGALV